MEITAFEPLIVSYDVIKEQIEQLEKKKEELRDKIATEMHKQGLNEVSIRNSNNDNVWKCEYQSRTSRTTNYNKLMEFVGPEKYHEVVTTKESTSLYIRQQKNKTEKSELSGKAPNPNKVNAMVAPGGVLA